MASLSPRLPPSPPAKRAVAFVESSTHLCICSIDFVEACYADVPNGSLTAEWLTYTSGQNQDGGWHHNLEIVIFLPLSLAFC